MEDRDQRAAVAERAARGGGAVAGETKADATDVVTAVDRAAQRRAIAAIREEFPDDAFVCEEPVVGEDVDSREAVPETGAAWIVDPIDGTANYVRGLDAADALGCQHPWTRSLAST